MLSALEEQLAGVDSTAGKSAEKAGYVAFADVAGVPKRTRSGFDCVVHLCSVGGLGLASTASRPSGSTLTADGVPGSSTASPASNGCLFA